ncbi:group III truncated hemoglobin [Halosquirtibacter xylanolyticus]|uniref:group III truncated hemoglobin n=1 Tax=Halosquirtibacter xylanolyticus TaxID=3374599 RepID=UPI003747BDA0|nr:group III truncated hemoglobin [Prolixibacteraceae bacterium]
MKHDITNEADIKLMVDSFYAKVGEDEILAPIFNEKIQGNWPEHLEKMYRFWGSMLLDQNNYVGNPLMKHLTLPISEEHFERWVQLFLITLDELFFGPVADHAKVRAQNIAKMFQQRIGAYKDKPFSMD